MLSDALRRPIFSGELLMVIRNFYFGLILASLRPQGRRSGDPEYDPRTLCILTVDGGGSRGILPASLLQMMENDITTMALLEVDEALKNGDRGRAEAIENLLARRNENEHLFVPLSKIFRM